MLVTRRAFLGGAAAGATGLWLGGRGLAQPTHAVHAARLRERLEALSAFGRPSGATFADGVSRVAYSDADIAGRKYVLGLMTAAGLAPRIDPAGNIFGRRRGTDPALPPILFGSHIDTVPSGGNFDGTLGSLAALGALEALDTVGHATRHPLEMVVWAHEEGVAFSRGLAASRIVAGDIRPADLEQTWSGLTRADSIRRIGGDPDRILEARREKGAFRAYLELHIEQGGHLDRDKIPIGVVQGIVAIERHEARITGFANHAGTTPMAERQDAALAAAHLTVAVREAVTARPGRHVGTVGRLEISPNAPNVVPGSARLTIELRDLAPATLARLMDDIRRRAAQIADTTRTTIDLVEVSRNPPALADDDVQAAVARAADARGLASVRMPSGAGHDAQMLAQLAPMGMIFVPSVGGISHSPKELTSWDDCGHGADVLLGAILEMDGL